MPYISTPPGLCSASKIVTSCPIWTRSPATVSPAGARPDTQRACPSALRSWDLDVPGDALEVGDEPFETSDRHRLPLLPRTHGNLALLLLGADAAAHAGRAFVSLIFLAASMNFPFATRSMNSGIWTLTGTPSRIAGSCTGCSGRLQDGEVGCEPERDFPEVPYPHLRGCSASAAGGC